MSNRNAELYKILDMLNDADCLLHKYIRLNGHKKTKVAVGVTRFEEQLSNLIDEFAESIDYAYE